MTHRWSRVLLLFLVLSLVLGGVAGCSRSAAVRDVPVAAAAEAEGSAERVAEVESPADIVVSAVTPGPDTSDQPVAPVVTEDVPVVVIPTSGIMQEEVTEPEPEPTALPETEESPPDTGAEFVWHTVSRGETLAGIAARYGTTASAISRANGISDPNLIYTGQRLKIPTSEGSGSSSGSGCRYRHTVRSGEWIWQIGRVYGVSGNAILQANGLTIASGSNIQPGTVLCIP